MIRNFLNSLLPTLHPTSSNPNKSNQALHTTQPTTPPTPITHQLLSPTKPFLLHQTAWDNVRCVVGLAFIFTPKLKPPQRYKYDICGFCSPKNPEKVAQIQK